MILCDIDNVLATNCGRDTAIGEPIYRTFVQMPTAFHDIRRACVPIHVVTAKAEREARQILAAIGLSAWVDSVIGANKLLWATLLDGVARGRAPTKVSKAFYRRFLSDIGAGPVVMIEDREGHLEDMLSHESIDGGVLVPPILFDGNHVAQWFDLNAALLAALAMVLGTRSVRARSAGMFVADQRIIRLPPERPGLGGVPAVTADQLATGELLRKARLSPISVLRQVRKSVLHRLP
jgi:hypothetical protein